MPCSLPSFFTCNKPGMTKCHIHNKTQDNIVHMSAYQFNRKDFIGQRNPSVFDGKQIKSNKIGKFSLQVNESQNDCLFTLSMQFEDESQEIVRFNQKACLEDAGELDFNILKASPYRTIEVIPDTEERTTTITLNENDFKRVQDLREEAEIQTEKGEYKRATNLLQQALKFAKRGGANEEDSAGLVKSVLYARADIYNKIGMGLRTAGLALEAESSIEQAYEQAGEKFKEAKAYFQLAADDCETNQEYLNNLRYIIAKIRGNSYYKEAIDMVQEAQYLWSEERDQKKAVKKYEASVASLLYAQDQFGRYNDPMLKASLDRSIRTLEDVKLSIIQMSKTSTSEFHPDSSGQYQ